MRTRKRSKATLDQDSSGSIRISAIKHDSQGPSQQISTMPITNHFLPVSTFTLVILTLLQYLHPASSQTTSLSAAATSTLPASSSSSANPFYNFTYPTFPDHYQSGIQVSYKDTIDVSWVANGQQHSPVLQIQCWTRNDSSSFICVYFIDPAHLSHSLGSSIIIVIL